MHTQEHRVLVLNSYPDPPPPPPPSPFRNPVSAPADRGPMGLGQYTGLGQYCSSHTASSVFLLSVLPHARLYNYVQWLHLPMQGVTGDAPRPAHVGQQLAVVATVELGQHDVM